MKKSVLMITASAAMLFAAPGQGGMMTMDNMKMPKCQCKWMMNQGASKAKCTCGSNCQCGKGMGKSVKMMRKKHMNSPFLIKHGLPHLTKMIMPYLKDPAFGLSADQKKQLAKIRIDTIGSIKQIKPEVMKLRKEIVKASTSGASADSLKEKVEKLAALEAKATMIHLKCIEKTKAVLTKDQLLFLLTNKNKMQKHGMKKMMKAGTPKQGQMKMKCAPGKCGGAK